MNFNANTSFQAADFINPQNVNRPKKNLSHARIATQSYDSGFSKRPLTAKGTGFKSRPANLKLGVVSHASKEILQSANCNTGTTATASRQGGIIRLTSQDTKTFMSSKTGSKARINVEKRGRQSGGALPNRPKTAMGGPNYLSNALLSQSLAAQKKHSLGAYAHGNGQMGVNSAINVRISKVSDAASDRALSDNLRVKLSTQKGSRHRLGLNSTQKTAMSGHSAESHLPAVTTGMNSAKFEYANVYTRQPSPRFSSEQNSEWSLLKMRPVSVQSKQVMIANSQLVNNLSILHNLERRRDGTDVVRSSQGQSLKEQLALLDKKFKYTQVQLNSIVTGASQVIVVSPEQAASIEVASMNTAIVKIETKQHKGPLSFTIDMHKEGDLTCFAHTNAKVNFEHKIWTYRYNLKERAKPMIFTPFKAFDQNMLSAKQNMNDIDKNQWQPEALYAQFFSEEGCTLSLKVTFVEEEILRANRNNRKGNTQSGKLMRGKFYEQFSIDKMINEAVNKKAAVKAFYKQIEDLKKARRIRERTNVKDNFIEINCDQAEDYVFHNAQAAQRKKDVRVERQIMARMNREYRTETAYRKNVLSLSKWDFLRNRKAESEAFVAETLRQRRQMKKLLIMAARHEFISQICKTFRDRVEAIRRHEMEIKMVTKIQRNVRIIFFRKGEDMKARQRLTIKHASNLNIMVTGEVAQRRAKEQITKFLVASQARFILQRSLRALPRFIDCWALKAKEVRRVMSAKREFLSQIFERELRIMMQFYHGKKKHKKVYQKLENIKQHNLEHILDDYFYGVCYEFYKRQMQIWVLLRHKYLRTSAVKVEERRFLYQEMSSNLKSLSGAKSSGAPVQAQKAKFPIYFTQQESESILRGTEAIQAKIESIIRGTTEAAAVGNLAENISLTQPSPPASPNLKSQKTVKVSHVEEEEKHAEVERRPGNRYKEMGIEDTAVLKRISTNLGVSLVGKKSRKDNQSPKVGQKGKNSANKSASKKQKLNSMASDLSNSLVQKQYMVSAAIPEPIFRYIPDRDTMQRLITRCSNMRDDLAEFGIMEDAGMAGEDGQAAQAEQPNQETF